MRRVFAIALLVLTAVACEPAAASLTPIGEPRIDCQGVPPQQCQEALDQARSTSRVPLVELVIRCTAPPCTIQQGQIEARARYADGTEQSFGSGWSRAVPAQPGVEEPVGPLPVQPACLGVPQQLCLDMASSAISELGPGTAPVRSITVRCTAVCTPTKAEGDTTVLFVDGSTTTSGWGYESTGG